MKPESMKALGAIDVPEQLLRSPLERFRQNVPDAVRAMAEIVVDNPGQIALITAGSMVATNVALNLVKPRTLSQAVALFIVLQVGLPKLATAAVQRGWITFRVRDDDGNLVPLVIGKPA